MALFGRKRREEKGPESEPGPGWAAPMSQDETAAFLEAVGRELDRRGLPNEVGDGEVQVERGGESSAFGLSNLGQLCHQIGTHEWQEAIGVHFDNLFAAADAEAELQELAGDFDNVRSMFKVRLYGTAQLGGVDPSPPASWELATGLTAAFVYDLPTTVRTASATHLEAWGRTRDGLLAVALENVRADTVETKSLAEGRSAPVACFADHFFAASHAFLLGERLPAEAKGSAVFAVPHRHALLYAPLVDLGVVESIQRLILTTASMFSEGLGSISPGLYWWRNGAVTPLPAHVDGPNIAFVPPDEFVQAMEELPAPG